MPRVPQAPPAGVVRLGTGEASAGRWYDANNVRWRQGQIQPVGGNMQVQASAVLELPRDVLTWHDNSLTSWAAFGTDDHLYALDMTHFVLYDITPGDALAMRRLGVVSPMTDSPSNSVGYGIGIYGSGVYGSGQAGPPTDGDITVFHGDRWCMDTFGEILLVLSTTNGVLHSWNPNTPSTPAAVVSAAPTSNRGLIVTDQRQAVLLGASGDPRNIAWSDQENFNVWTPAVDNLAGSKFLVTQAYAMTAVKVPQGILIFTSRDVHLMNYVGPPYAYGITQVGAGCGPLSLRVPVVVGPVAIWPGTQNFWLWNGSIQPQKCDVGDWFFKQVNRNFVGRVFGSAVQEFSEMWWDWPDAASTECNRYIAVNFNDPKMPWTIGMRQRTAGLSTGSTDAPILGGPLGSGGALFIHEYGWTDNGAPRASTGSIYAESGAIVNGEGDKRFNCTGLIYDADTDSGLQNLGYQFKTRENPGASETATQLYTVQHDGIMDMRWSARTARMRMQAINDADFSVGRPRLMQSSAGYR